MNVPQGRIRWSNVLVIFQREVRDQVRDRRTLFMVFVLPILLYPLLGIGTAKLAELMQEQSRKVVLVGGEWLRAGFRRAGRGNRHGRRRSGRDGSTGTSSSAERGEDRLQPPPVRGSVGRIEDGGEVVPSNDILAGARCPKAHSRAA